MDSITVRQFRNHFNSSYEFPLKITSDGQGIAVLLSISQYNQLVAQAKSKEIEANHDVAQGKYDVLQAKHITLRQNGELVTLEVDAEGNPIYV